MKVRIMPDPAKHETYAAYTRRCLIKGLKPRDFYDWLKFELAQTTRNGGHRKFDDVCEHEHEPAADSDYLELVHG